MNYTDGLLFSMPILCSVWLTFERCMEDWVEQIGLENIVYSYCDCIFTPLEHVDAPEGYEISLKHQFKWLVIYNMQRLIGLNEKGEIKRLHFNRILNLKLFDYLDETIDKLLMTNPIEWLRNPKLPDRFLESLPFDAFRIVVFKKNNVCKNVDYLELWDEFHYGLNDVFLSKKGVTTDSSKIDFRKYGKYVKYYLNLHKFKGD